MDYSKTPLHGQDLIKKDALKTGEQLKVDYLRARFSKIKLLEHGKRHIEFLNNLNDTLCKNKTLSEAQIKYLDTLYEQMLED